LARASAWLVIGGFLFVAANIPDDSIPVPNSPETRMYWLFHSLWHLFSCLASKEMILAIRKTTIPDCHEHLP